MDNKLTEQEIKMHKTVIDGMSQEEMARLVRFAPSGHQYFISGTELTKYFAEKYKEKGGMTPEISKRIG